MGSPRCWSSRPISLPTTAASATLRGTSVSKSWDQATTYAAIEVASKIGKDLARYAKCKEDDPNRRQSLQDFCRRFAERAFRRPLSLEQQSLFVDAHFAGDGDAETAVKKSLLLVLKSPRFLYLGLNGGKPDAFEVASRLSFGLWDSLPDEELLAAASRGALGTPDEVARQARRMLADPRTKSKLRSFFQTWLRFDLSHDLSKDKQLYPDFDKAIVCDLRTSLELSLDEAVWGEAPDIRRLFQADYLFLNKRLADFYGLAVPEQNGFHKVSVDPQQRAGLATHPFLLSTLAYHKSSSPIHRGVFLIRGLLGRTLLPPPIAVAPLDEGFDPNLTTRERVTLQTKPDLCQSCHSMINPLGFTLENYDAVGRYRGEEKSKPIDASGFYKTVAGERIELAGPRPLAEFLSQSEEMHRSLVEHLFHHFVKQPVNAYGADQLAA